MPPRSLASTLLVALGFCAPAAASESAPCSGRAGCSVVLEEDAALADGPRLAVLRVELPDASRDCRPALVEYWLRRDEGAPQRLFSLCNDGYGASGIGEDEVEVSPGMIVQRQYGGSAWRWSEERLVDFEPLRLAGSTSCSFHAAASESSWVQVDWSAKGFAAFGRLAFDGVGTDWGAAGACGEGEEAPPRFVAVPRIEGAGGLASELQAARGGLGTCAAWVGEGGSPGHALLGDAAGLAFRAVVLGDRLLVEVPDGAGPPTASDRWIRDDRVEVWVGPLPAGLMGDKPAPPRQFGVRLADGAVFPGHGMGRDLPAAVAWRREGATVASVDLGKLLAGIDAGREGIALVLGRAGTAAQGPMLSTAAVRRGRAETLGILRSPKVDCALAAGRLERGEPAVEFLDTGSD